MFGKCEEHGLLGTLQAPTTEQEGVVLRRMGMPDPFLLSDGQMFLTASSSSLLSHHNATCCV